MMFDLDGPLSPFNVVEFHSLLLSCRVIYGEVSALLFSSNRFVIHCRNEVERPISLQSLRNLTASSLAALTSLKIVLSQTSCHYRKLEENHGICCDQPRSKVASENDFCQRLHTTLHNRPLQSSQSAAALILDEWLRTADYLSLTVSPRALELSLVCDLDRDEADTARQIVAPLSLLPELKDCHIRLCRSPDPELAHIARTAALQACGRVAVEPTSTSTPRLTSLPRELRLSILEYTDLVTPWNEITWTRVERGYQPPAEGCYANVDTPCPLHHGCQFSRCYFQKGEKPGGIVVCDDSIGCFCRLRHAAFSSTCRCWAPPTPLFLICRALLEDARLVFFSLNRFVVGDTLASRSHYVAFDVLKALNLPNNINYRRLPEWYKAQPPDSYPAERFAASQFLREVVPADCLGYLRFLELVFPPYNHNCWPPHGHPALQDWVETIDWVKNKINTPNITLRLTMAAGKAPQHPDRRYEATRSQGSKVLAGYRRILKPLAHLGGNGGLTRFHADLAWPLRWTATTNDMSRKMGYEAFQAWMISVEDGWNERIERFILGDRYKRLPVRSRKVQLEERPWKLHCPLNQ